MFVLFVFDLCVLTTCGVGRGIINQLGLITYRLFPFFVFDLCMIRNYAGHIVIGLLIQHFFIEQVFV